MKKMMKKIVFTSLCFALCGALYIADGFATKENINVENAKKTEVNIVTSETLPTTDGYCIDTKQKAIDYIQETKGKVLRPMIAYVYNGEPLYDFNGDLYLTDNTEAELSDLGQCPNGADSWYFDADMTNKVNITTGKTADAMRDITITEWDANGCGKKVEIITVLYIKCNTNSMCDSNYNKNYTITYNMADGSKSYKSHTYGDTVNVNEVTDTKEGAIFEGWYYSNPKTDPNAVKATSKNIIDYIKPTKVNGCVTGYEGINLYPKWQGEDDCPMRSGGYRAIVKFNTMGGNAIDDITICTTCTPTTIVLPTPEKEGYVFEGWYADSQFTQKVEGIENGVANANFEKVDCYDYETTIYAKFEKSTVNPETGDMFFIYIALGLVLVVGSGVAIKKLASNK